MLTEQTKLLNELKTIKDYGVIIQDWICCLDCLLHFRLYNWQKQRLSYGKQTKSLYRKHR